MLITNLIIEKENKNWYQPEICGIKIYVSCLKTYSEILKLVQPKKKQVHKKRLPKGKLFGTLGVTIELMLIVMHETIE